MVTSLSLPLGREKHSADFPFPEFHGPCVLEDDQVPGFLHTLLCVTGLPVCLSVCTHMKVSTDG